MGFFTWLFKKVNNSTKTIYFEGEGKYLQEIVGESYYQDTLEKITNGKTENGHEKKVKAKLIYDDNNPYDNKAIAIKIENKLIGHLSRNMARKFRKKMEKEGHNNITVVCDALIVGGWHKSHNDEGYFGVKLDFTI